MWFQNLYAYNKPELVDMELNRIKINKKSAETTSKLYSS